MKVRDLLILKILNQKNLSRKEFIALGLKDYSFQNLFSLGLVSREYHKVEVTYKITEAGRAEFMKIMEQLLL